MVVVCSVGIDLDLVPSAADARLALDPAARLLLALPERDVHPVTRRLAARLVEPAEIVAVLARSLVSVLERLAALEHEFAAVEAELADPAVLADPNRLRRGREAAQGARADRVA